MQQSKTHLTLQTQISNASNKPFKTNTNILSKTKQNTEKPKKNSTIPQNQSNQNPSEKLAITKLHNIRRKLNIKKRQRKHVSIKCYNESPKYSRCNTNSWPTNTNTVHFHFQSTVYQ